MRPVWPLGAGWLLPGAVHRSALHMDGICYVVAMTPGTPSPRRDASLPNASGPDAGGPDSGGPAQVGDDATPDSTRDAILVAAVEAASIHGVARLSMTDVAKAARLSRPTLYRYFPSKEDLLAAALLRETMALVSEVAAAVGPITDPRDAIEAGVLVTLRLVREHPLLDRIVRTEPETLVPVLVAEGDPAVPSFPTIIRGTVAALLAAKLPDLDEVRLRRLADVLARLLVSYSVNAPDDPPEVVAASIADLVTSGVLARPTGKVRP